MRLEHLLYTLPLRLRSLFRRTLTEQELEEEFQFHLDQRIRQAIEAGNTPEEARYEALRAMDGVEQQKERCRDTRGVSWMEDAIRDGLYAFKALLRTPGYTAVAVLIVALGIGVNTSVFTLVNAVLLQPLRFKAPNRLFMVEYTPKNNPFIPAGPTMSDRDYAAFRRQDQAFESLATLGNQPVTLTGAGDPVILNASQVTADFFRVLGIPPAIGRDFLPEGQPDTNVVLLSDHLWRSRFGGDLAIVGKSITLDGVSFDVAGVMPQGFAFQDAELWTRLELQTDSHNSFIRPVIGRLKPGVSPQQAQAELEAFSARQPREPGESADGFAARIIPLRELFVADSRKLLLIFAGAVACVFLIACANFANLLLIRGASRQHEMAVRAALGASRWRLLRQLLTESTLLSLTGGALGVLLSAAGVKALLALLPPGKIPRADDIQMDAWVLAFTLTLSLFTGIVFGLVPGLNAVRCEFWEPASQGSRSVTARRERFRNALVTFEIALAMLLLVGAGVLLKSFGRLRSVDPGFRSTNLLTATVDLPGARYESAAQMRALHDRVLRALSVLPGAESVAAVNWVPLRPNLTRGDFQLDDGRQLPPGFLVDKPAVSPDYFHTMGVPLLRGRTFTERDGPTSPGVVVISEAVARRLWPAGDAIGKHISMEDKPQPGDWLTIVGVVGDVRQTSLAGAPSATVYQPYRQIAHPFFLGHMTFLLHTNGNPLSLASEVRAVIHTVDPELPTQSVVSMDAIVSDTMTELGSQARLLGLFSVMALLLAAIGVYGLLAYSVSGRTHEIGIRMALGADKRNVLWMVLRQTLTPVGGGLIIGALGAAASTRVLSKLLFEVSPTDPETFSAVGAVLVIVALASAWIPAQRATRVYPQVALRHE